MDVGDVGTTAIEPISAPTTLPETGADLWLAAIALLTSGAALVGLGRRLRRQS
jgi:LPXTG-motif cell wall-anchored protein